MRRHSAALAAASAGSAVLAAVLLAAAQKSGAGVEFWTQSGYADFVRGSFQDGGANMYVSAKGRVEQVHRLDLNNDGQIDLAFANSHGHLEKVDAVIYWGGGPSFDISRSSSVPTDGAHFLIPADVDGDGHIDLVVPNYQNGTYDSMDSFIYMNGGTRKPAPHAGSPWYFFPFSRRISLPGTGVVHAAVGDLNRDGFPDVVLAFSPGFWEYRANPWEPNANPSRIYWGSAQGFRRDNFQEVPTLGASAVAIADLNRDGWPDLVVASQNVAGRTGVDSHVYWGGPGGISAARRIGLPTRAATMVKVADVNRDGHADLIFANGEGERSFIYLSGADGFSPSRRIEVETYAPRDVAVADVNRDGYPDILFSCNNRSGNPYTTSFLYLGSKDGFSNRGRVEFESIGAWGAAMGDLNGDGLPDVVIANFQDYASYDVPSYIYWNSPSGFDPTRRTNLYTHGAAGCAIADLDGDGHPDLIFANTTARYRGDHGPSWIYWGNATGQFSVDRRQALPSMDAYGVTGADLNDDGYPDLIVSNNGETGRLDQEAYIYWGGPDGFSTWRMSGLMSHFNLSARTADLDRDGYLDVVVSGNRESFIYWGSAEGYSELVRTSVPSQGMATIADLNRDGHLDVLIVGAEIHGANQGATIYWEDGTRNYSALRKTFIAGIPPGEAPNVADVNGDGYLDLLFFNRSPSYIYYGNENGTFSDRARTVLETPGATRPIVADFNKDGLLDLLVPAYVADNKRDTMSQLFWGSPDGYSGKRVTLLPSFGGAGGLAADFNHDGWLDALIVCHRKDGSPDRLGAYGDHLVDSLIYWGGPGGFRTDRVERVPSAGAHYDYGIDLGNIYDRRPRFEYISQPFFCGGKRPVRVEWDASTPYGSELSVDFRSAASSGALKHAPWQGPGGPGSAYRSSGSAVSGLTGPWIQYRAIFLSSDGVTYPVLRRTSVELR